MMKTEGFDMEKEFKGTKGNWSVGKHPSTVVSSEKVRNTNFPIPPNREYSSDEDIEHYGGYLVAESIGDKADANLIATSKELLEALQSIIIAYTGSLEAEGYDENEEIINAKKVINKALGETK